MRVLLSFLIAFAIASHAVGKPADAEAAVRDFYRAYASGDGHAAAAFWTRDAATSFTRRAERTLHTRCLVLHAVEAHVVSVDAGHATVMADVWLTHWSAMSGAVAEDDQQRATLVLRPEDGSWKIDSWRMHEDELADRLVEATSDAERDACLRDASPLHTRHLVEALCRRAVTANNQAHGDLAKTLAGIAASVANELEDAVARGEALSVESILQRSPPRNDIAGSVSTAEAAVELAANVRDPDILARALLRFGNALLAASDSRDAGVFERAVALADYVEDVSILAFAASGAARSHERVGRLRESLHAAAEAARWAEQSGEPAAIVSAELNLAGSYLKRLDSDLALPHAERALRLSELAGFGAVRGTAQSFVAYAFLTAGDEERFLTAMARSIDLAESAGGDPRSRVELLANRARILVGRRDFAGAEADLQRAFADLRTMPERVTDEAELENMLAYLRLREGRPEEALRAIERGLRLLDQRGASSGGLRTTQAGIFEELGRLGEARRAYADAVDGVEEMRATIDYERERSLYLGNVAGVYAAQVHLLVRLGQRREALLAAERMKARVLQDLRSSAALRDSVRDPALDALNMRVVALNRELMDTARDGGDPSGVRARLRRARGELDEAHAIAEQPRPSPRPPPLDFSVIDVPRDAIVVEFVVGEDRTTAFLVRKEGADTRVQTHTIDIPAQELRSLVKDYVRRLEQRDVRFRAASHHLYDIFLAPLLGAQPPPGATLCIIPDSVLWMLPFHALLARDGHYVIEHMPVFYSPSLSMLNAPPRSPTHRAPTVLALGDPELDMQTRSEVRSITGAGLLGRLPDAEHEVREIGRMYGSRSTVRVGREAAESLLKKNAGDYDVLHLATHGIIDEHTPLYSAVVLAASDTEDGLLEAREIVDLPLHADLVVLSACDTAGGRVLSGEGVMGVSWAMLAAGTPRVVATQWPVGSAASARLMIAFHRGLTKRPAIARVAETLRAAQLEMLRRRESAHPHDWAAFILIGRD